MFTIVYRDSADGLLSSGILLGEKRGVRGGIFAFKCRNIGEIKACHSWDKYTNACSLQPRDYLNPGAMLLDMQFAATQYAVRG